MSFKLFIEQEEEDKDILKTLSKIPSSHSDLIKGYNVKLIPGNTLDGDDDHIGYMDDSPKEIVVASPWNYGREFTLLHEIGHRVWGTLQDKLKYQWESIVNYTKNKYGSKNLDQSPEELFCMAYAQTFVETKTKKFDFQEWIKFIENICRNHNNEKF